MESPVTFRLDKRMREGVARIARKRRKTASQIVREAIEAYIDREESSASLYDRMSHLAGVVEAEPERSANAGRKVAALLKARRSRS
jgi:predicted transcriptional regulator